VNSFGWSTTVINGHDIGEIADALAAARQVKGKPSAIIANTVKGMGVSHLIDRPELHYKAPSTEERNAALEDLS